MIYHGPDGCKHYFSFPYLTVSTPPTSGLLKLLTGQSTQQHIHHDKQTPLPHVPAR